MGGPTKATIGFNFWQHENHPILLDNLKMYDQRLVYLHENPVRTGFVREPQEWLFSSAIDYYVPNGKGLLDLAGLD